MSLVTVMAKRWMAVLICLLPFLGAGQGVEGLFIERYKEHTSGETTYRIFVDLEEGYRVLAVFGNDTHPLRITSTEGLRHAPSGDKDRADEYAVEQLTDPDYLYDSWISIGGLGVEYTAVPKDTMNIHEGMPAPGLVPLVAPALVVVGFAGGIFHQGVDGSGIATTNGCWAALQGAAGATEDNMVLIGQFTTRGQLSGVINLQLRSPDGRVIRCVAAHPAEGEVMHPCLTFN